LDLAGAVMPKQITVACHGPIAVSRKYRSPWEDVRLSWTGKPGRKKYHLVVSLFSKPSAVRYHRELTAHDGDGESDEQMHQSGLAIEAMDHGKRHLIMTGCDNLPDVYSPEEFIDRAEAERMIADVMRANGYENIRCKWKRPKFIITPI